MSETHDRDTSATLNPDIHDTSSRCNLCGSADFEPLSGVGRGNVPLSTVICRQCGLVWSHPFPIDPFNYYQKDYRIRYKGVFKPKMKHILRAAYVALERFKLIRRFLKPGHRILDVGSGGGEFLYMARKLGCEVTGIEPNEGYAEFSKEEYGLDVLNGFLQNTPVQDNAFDMITLWHVFEHMDNPLQVLKTVHGYLKPGGLLVIEVPNIEAICQAPINTFHTAHLFNFNHKTLGKMGELAGFTTIHETMSEDGGNICRVFKKAETPDGPHPVDMVDNFQKTRDLVRRRSNLRHYLTRHPYSRLFSRLRRTIHEKLTARRFTSGKQILENVMAEID